MNLCVDHEWEGSGECPECKASDDVYFAALAVLRADAKDWRRPTMWRYGVKHALTIIERALGDR